MDVQVSYNSCKAGGILGRSPRSAARAAKRKLLLSTTQRTLLLHPLRDMVILILTCLLQRVQATQSPCLLSLWLVCTRVLSWSSPSWISPNRQSVSVNAVSASLPHRMGTLLQHLWQLKL